MHKNMEQTFFFILHYSMIIYHMKKVHIIDIGLLYITFF